MPREFGRNKRVADLVQREVAVFIQRDQSNPIINFVTISVVDVSPDLKNAKIYVTSLTDNVDKEQIIKVLNEQSAHYRHQLSKKLSLRSVPTLKFYFDNSIERAAHLSALIDSLNTED